MAVKRSLALRYTAMEKKKALALGFFDGVHAGHLNVLRLASAYAEKQGIVPCAVTFDEHPLSVITGTPVTLISSKAERERLLRSVGGMDEVIMLPFRELRDMEPEDFVREILFKSLNGAFVCCGSDYRFGKDGKGDGEMLKSLCHSLGIEFALACQLDDGESKISSSRLRDAIISGNMELARRLLSRPYSFSGEVIHGKALGRKISSPTMNVRITETLLPRGGVYASFVTVKGIRYESVTNINSKGLAEIFAFADLGYVYGETVFCELKSHIRDMISFSSLDELRNQISADCEESARRLRKAD
ncbi:MAG: riboflavin biosynthesis protein RibF [Clostridiales bacterium]|nr:riboflavin biosynthesis protein RibF [Clostridiales bacterium]